MFMAYLFNGIDEMKDKLNKIVYYASKKNPTKVAVVLEKILHAQAVKLVKAERKRILENLAK